MSSATVVSGSVPAFVYVSNATDQDLACFALAADGTLSPLGRARIGDVVGPTAASPDGRFLYAASRTQPCSVHAFAIEGDGALRPLGASPLAESFPYISLDRTGRWLFGAAYAGNMMSVNAVGADGRVAPEASQVLPIARNAHAIRIDGTNRNVYVPALGTDLLYLFRFDPATGRIEPNTPPAVALPAVTGPRHFALSPDNRFLFLIGEMRGTVTTFAIDPVNGTLRAVAEASILPPGSTLIPGAGRGAAAPAGAPPRDTSRDVWAAEIHVTPNGQFLYATERTESRLTAFRIDAATGSLTPIGYTPTELQPRGFAIDASGRWLVACGERSEHVAVHAIDPATGQLSAPRRTPGGRGANWVTIVG